jgi:hypothetical protein
MSRILPLSIVISLTLSLLSCSGNSIQSYRSDRYKYGKQNNGYFIEVQKLEDDKNANSLTYEPRKSTFDALEKKEIKNIALAIPTSGKYASVGKAILDSVIFVVTNSKNSANIKINVYNITKLESKNEELELEKLLNSNNDIIVGSIFPETTKRIVARINKRVNDNQILRKSLLANNPSADLTVVPEIKPIILISLSNDKTTIYDNVISFGNNEIGKIKSLFDFLQYNNRKYFAAILPSNATGYLLDKKIRQIAKQNNILVVINEFYQEEDIESIKNAVSKINRYYKTTYNVDSKGNLVTEDIKLLVDSNKLAEHTEKKNRQEVFIDSIFISANEASLSSVLPIIYDSNLCKKDILFFTNSPVDFATTHNATFNSSFYFIGYDFNYVSKFNSKFREIYKYNPNAFTYLTNDILASILYIYNQSGSVNLSNLFYSGSGFHGILDDFRFNRNGTTQRRFNIYKNLSSNQEYRMNIIYKPVDFY